MGRFVSWSPSSLHFHPSLRRPKGTRRPPLPQCLESVRSKKHYIGKWVGEVRVCVSCLVVLGFGCACVLLFFFHLSIGSFIVYLFLYLSLNLLSVYPYKSIYLSLYLSILLFVYYLSVYLYKSIYLSILPFAYYLSVCLSLPFYFEKVEQLILKHVKFIIQITKYITISPYLCKQISTWDYLHIVFLSQPYLAKW